MFEIGFVLALIGFELGLFFVKSLFFAEKWGKLGLFFQIRGVLSNILYSFRGVPYRHLNK